MYKKKKTGQDAGEEKQNKIQGIKQEKNNIAII